MQKNQNMYNQYIYYQIYYTRQTKIDMGPLCYFFQKKSYNYFEKY